jgi:hypothetical protein
VRDACADAACVGKRSAAVVVVNKSPPARVCREAGAAGAGARCVYQQGDSAWVSGARRWWWACASAWAALPPGYTGGGGACVGCVRLPAARDSSLECCLVGVVWRETGKGEPRGARLVPVTSRATSFPPGLVLLGVFTQATACVKQRRSRVEVLRRRSGRVRVGTSRCR